jgi:hypothetical protein
MEKTKCFHSFEINKILINELKYFLDCDATNMNKHIFTLLFTILLACQFVNGQTEPDANQQVAEKPMPSSEVNQHKGFSFTAGLGHYELLNVGTQWNFGKRSSFSLYGGSNLGLSDETSWSVGFSYDEVFLKPRNWKLKPGYSLGAIYWTNDDALYFFRCASFPVMALLAYPISPSLTIRLEGGAVFSAVLQSDRKQNVESGYPDRYNGNIRINLIYKFKRK